PNSGNEKGHVEAMVKYIRNNYLLPAEYCGQNEPPVRSFEPPCADNRASECGGESHLIIKGGKQTAIGMVLIYSNGC
ncbi:hypothetical protein, partial [Bacillus sp. REN3]|uniref:hypothetical protein n=1 Tax=Bacillus sp. REN3 TaxID=2802440 RepID=UPI001AEE829A